MTERDVKFLSPKEHVRLRTTMYFGRAWREPGLANSVFRQVVDLSLHWAEGTTPVVAEISGDLSFAVTDDHALLPHANDDLLLRGDRVASTAATALSRRAVVTVWRDSLCYHQELAFGCPAHPPRPRPAPPGRGTRVELDLDPECFAPGDRIGVGLVQNGLVVRDSRSSAL